MRHLLKLRLRFSALFLVAFLPAFLPPVTQARDFVPEGSLLAPSIRFQFAVYLPGDSKSSPLASFDALVKGPFAGWKKVESMTDDPTERLVRAQLETNVRANYAVPPVASLGYFGRGLTREQVDAVQHYQTAMIVDFAYPSSDRFAAMKSALQMMLALARECDGLIWDEITRELFTPDYWEKSRISGWQGEIPDVTKQITMHAYQEGDHARVITLGMAKFGQPDVIVQEFAWSNNSTIGNLINLIAQLLVEGATVDKNGTFSLDVRAVRDASVREPQVTALKSNATGKTLVKFKAATAEAGDPENRLVQIEFLGPKGENTLALQDRTLGAVFGWSDSVSFVNHNQAILDASRAAREKFKGYEAEYRKGRRPGEIFKVKSPFSIPGGGREWMWVEVTKWKGNKIHGVLMNAPLRIPSLRSGAEVDVNVDEIFDYIRYFPDGTSEGNTTAELIERASTETVPVPGSAK